MSSELKSVLIQLGWSERLTDAFISSDLAPAVQPTELPMPTDAPRYLDVDNMVVSAGTFPHIVRSGPSR